MANKRRQFKLVEFKDGDPVVACIAEFLDEIGQGHQIHMINRLLAIGYLEHPALVDDASHADQRIGDKTIRKFRMRLNPADPCEADLDHVFSQIRQRQVDALFTRLVVGGYQALYQSHVRLARSTEPPVTEPTQWQSTDNVADTQTESPKQANSSASIVFCHAKKGGVGKSLVAALLIDYCIENGYPVALIEGDSSNPDVALRYEHRIQTRRVDFDPFAESKQVVRQFNNTVNQLASSDQNLVVVVNLSPRASEILDANADDWITTATESGHTCSVIHSIGQHREASAGTRRSIESGLAGALETDRVVIAYNKRVGEPEQCHYVTSGTRDEIGGNFQEITIPELKPRELARKVLATNRPLSELAREYCGELMSTERVLLQKRWLTPAHDAIARIMPALTPTARQDKA